MMGKLDELWQTDRRQRRRKFGELAVPVEARLHRPRQCLLDGKGSLRARTRSRSTSSGLLATRTNPAKNSTKSLSLGSRRRSRPEASFSRFASVGKKAGRFTSWCAASGDGGPRKWLE